MNLQGRWKFVFMFRNYSKFKQWPLKIWLQIVFLNRAYIREICCYCGQTLKFKRSQKIIGDSGEICPICLRQECPELYEQMKAESIFSSEQI